MRSTTVKPTYSAMEDFKARVLSASHLTSHPLIVGSTTNPALPSSSICNTHPSFTHQDQTAAPHQRVLRKHGIKSEKSDDWFWEIRKVQEEAPGYVVLANLLLESTCISMRYPALVLEAK